MTGNDLPYSAAADRNQAPILEVLARVLTPNAAVLEIASGTGQHALWLTKQRCVVVSLHRPARYQQPTARDTALTRANFNSLLGIARDPWQ